MKLKDMSLYLMRCPHCGHQWVEQWEESTGLFSPVDSKWHSWSDGWVLQECCTNPVIVRELDDTELWDD